MSQLRYDLGYFPCIDLDMGAIQSEGSVYDENDMDRKLCDRHRDR